MQVRRAYSARSEYGFCSPRFDLLFGPPSNTSTQQRATVQTVQSSTGTLNSWKEIAHYLDRGVRTIQRWEHGLGLPVHRIGKGKRCPVFATSSELNVWLSTIEGNRISKPPHVEPAGIPSVGNPRIASLRQLRLTLQNLRQTLAENSALQRRQTQLVKQQLAKLRWRINHAS